MNVNIQGLNQVLKLKRNIDLIKEIPALSERTYLDSAGAGLPPISVTNAMREFIDEWSNEGEKWEKWLQDVVTLRREFSKLVGSSEEEIAIVPSVSVGLASFASSLDLRNAKVVVSELNFPTNIILWNKMKRSKLVGNVKILHSKNGKIPIEEWEKEIDDETALVAVDYVSWLTGYKENLERIVKVAHSKGALVLVDGFHAVGVFPVDVKKLGVDVFVSGFYKWMCGPHGVACLYVSRKVLSETEPSYIGWHGINDNVIRRVNSGCDPFDLPLPIDGVPSPNCDRYEWGTWASVTVRGALESIKFAERFTPKKRIKHVQYLVKELAANLSNLGIKPITPYDNENEFAGIITFPAKKYHELIDELKRRKIIVSGRYGNIRVSPHFYNTVEEIDKLLKAVKEFSKKGQV